VPAILVLVILRCIETDKLSPCASTIREGSVLDSLVAALKSIHHHFIHHHFVYSTSYWIRFKFNLLQLGYHGWKAWSSSSSSPTSGWLSLISS
jgi:hypothetical protein